MHKGPLESAKEYVKSRGLESKVDCRLGDGLKVTQKGELNGAICCGMGGFLMRDIVDAGPEPLEFYVLQPQNGQKELRQYMVQKGYVIVLEIIVEDAGKLYTAFLAIPRRLCRKSILVHQFKKMCMPHCLKNPYCGLWGLFLNRNVHLFGRNILTI